ncbi:hypothetical protein HDU98_010626 [Podochytrium sp. JEL0797]|nr:hypothetical protein HDU98_010626 [Podochytrium sp. JEL0797]
MTPNAQASPTGPNTLNTRASFSTLGHNSRDPSPTSGHPAVFIPSAAFADPGLSTEELWEQEYAVEPETEGYNSDSSSQGSSVPDDAERNEMARRRSVGGKRHFPEPVDQVAEVLGEGSSQVDVVGMQMEEEEETARAVGDSRRSRTPERHMTDEEREEYRRLYHQQRVADIGYGKILRGEAMPFVDREY